MEELGFIITRSIQNEIHANYWKECVSCIRKFYKTERIIIIDDNSKYTSDPLCDECPDNNVEIVYSEYPGAGEILAYYYGFKLRPFKKSIILHDSMFLQERLPETDSLIKFQWHFDSYQHNGSGFFEFVSFLPKEVQQDIIDMYKNTKTWTGCFGVCSIVDIKFLDILFEKYKIQNILDHIKNRSQRESMERMIAIIAYLTLGQREESFACQGTRTFGPRVVLPTPSLFGNILTDYPHSFGYNWDMYQTDKKNGKNIGVKVVKLWSGR